MPKYLIVYSSRTGNTRRMAEAFYEAAPKGSRLAEMREDVDPTEFDAVFVGFWVDKGMPNAQARDYLSSLQHTEVVLFATLGADPESDHAKTSLQKAADLLADNCRVLDALAFRGAIDPKLIEAMRKRANPNSYHTPEQMRRSVEESAGHPNEADFAKARAYMEKFAQARG